MSFRNEIDEKNQISAIAAINDAISHFVSTARDDQGDFLILVKQFDEAIARVSFDEISETLRNKIKNGQDHILLVYATTFTRTAEKIFEGINLEKITGVKDLADKFNEVTAFSSDLSKSVMLEIINEENDVKRHLLIDRYITLADKLLTEGNFLCANAIFQGLNDKTCTRLYKNDLGNFALTAEGARKLEKLAKLFGKEPEKNEELVIAMKEQMQATFGYVLPALDKLTSDLEKKYAGKLDNLDSIKMETEDKIKLIEENKQEELDASDLNYFNQHIPDLNKLRSETVDDEDREEQLNKIKAFEEVLNKRLAERNIKFSTLEDRIKKITIPPDTNAKDRDKVMEKERKKAILSLFKEYPISKEILQQKADAMKVEIENDTKKYKNKLITDYKDIYRKDNHPYHTVLPNMSINPILKSKNLNYLNIINGAKSFDAAYNTLESKISFALKDSAKKTKELLTKLVSEIEKIETIFPDDAKKFKASINEIIQDKSFDVETFSKFSTRLNKMVKDEETFKSEDFKQSDTDFSKLRETLNKTYQLEFAEFRDFLTKIIDDPTFNMPFKNNIEKITEFRNYLNTVINDKSYHEENFQKAVNFINSIRIDLQNSITNPAEKMRKELAKMRLTKVEEVDKQSNKYFLNLQDKAKSDLIKKMPTYKKLLAYQDKLEKRCNRNPKDTVSKNKLNIFKKINKELCDMQMNQAKSEEMLDHIILRIRENEQLEDHHSKLKGAAHQDTTAIKILYDAHNDIINNESHDELGESRMAIYQALRNLKDYHGELKHRNEDKNKEEDKTKINVLADIINSVEVFPTAQQKINHLDKIRGEHEGELSSHRRQISELLGKDTTTVKLLNEYKVALKKEVALLNKVSLKEQDPTVRDLINELKQYKAQHKNDLDKQKRAYAEKLLNILQDGNHSLSYKVEKLNEFLHKDRFSIRHINVTHYFNQTDPTLVRIINHHMPYLRILSMKDPLNHEEQIEQLVDIFKKQSDLTLEKSFDKPGDFNKLDDRLQVKSLPGLHAGTYQATFLFQEADPSGISRYKIKSGASLLVRRIEHDEDVIKAREALKTIGKEEHLTKDYYEKNISRNVTTKGEKKGQPQLLQDIVISEFCQNGDLYAADRDEKNTDPDEMLPTRRENGIGYLTNLTAMMSDFRKANILFIDIKPSNFLLHDDGHLMISDVKSLLIVDRNSSTVSSKSVTRSSAYLPPEEFKKEKQIGGVFEIDIDAVLRYQVGITLYEYLTKDKISEVERKPPDYLHQFNFKHKVFDDDEGKFLRVIIQSLTHYDKNKRLSLETVKELCDQYQHGEPLNNIFDRIERETKRRIIPPKPLPKIPIEASKKPESIVTQNVTPSLSVKDKIENYINNKLVQLDERLKDENGSDEDKRLFIINKSRLETLRTALNKSKEEDILKDPKRWSSIIHQINTNLKGKLEPVVNTADDERRVSRRFK